ncbi:MAG TPA: BamA/TamA family outer membrane protein [Gemmatimonadales bacterium]|nr:BamA/TamA family outer membrane protein [Gemmatimonadales bacterium]
MQSSSRSVARSLGRTLVQVAIVSVLAHWPAGPLAAQYFGQNRVQYRTFDFKVIQTEHFDVYFYEEEREAALDAARMAERSYARLSRLLDHRFVERKPIILYASHSDFAQTNATPGGVSEGIEGVTDAYKHRNVLPFPGDYADFEHVLTHEMVHQFQYDIWARGRAGNIGALVAINPPGWFVEGMAEYLSIGPNDPNTAMWVRDAALDGKLPTIEQMTYDPYIFPYRYGHALLAYIGERWGDEAVGALLKGTLAGGVEGSIRRTLGMNSEQLSEEWHDAVQRRFLPAIRDKEKARDFGSELLSRRRDGGVYNIAPALSPDGSQVAFFSERGGFTVDLWLADGATGRVRRRLLKSTASSNYETYRFINSSVAWSPDGRFLVSAAKRGPKDDILVIDVRRNRVERRIEVPLAGVLTPSFSPDGKQIVFSGLEGGLSDLFIVNVDGTGLRRLTRDKYSDQNPVWSPDGRYLAFVTDRGPGTDFAALTMGGQRIALFDLQSDSIVALQHMDRGRNVSPQWSPDGRQVAFVSDRNGVANLYLYDLAGAELFQLTDLYTGIQGITPSSPVLSWARGVDRLAFVYYQKNEFDVYSVVNPRSLRRAPWADTTTGPPLLAALNVASPDRGTRGFEAPSGLAGRTTALQPDTARPAATAPDTAAPASTGGSFYRGQSGFRVADSAPAPDSTARPPVTVTQMLANDTLALPDTAEFTVRRYRIKFTPDYVAPPTLGYTRDNFGRGVYGGTTVVLSDLLGDRSLIFSGYVNGRLDEASILAAYATQRSRINYMVGLQQQPYFYLGQSQIQVDQPVPGVNTYVESVRRIVFRSAFAQAAYPFSRFRRVELGLEATHLDDGVREFSTIYDPGSGAALADPEIHSHDLPGADYIRPSVALTYDNSIFGYVGPFVGRRSRYEVSHSMGDWKLTQFTADYRRYDRLVGPFVFASRGLFIGRTGADSRVAPLFLGSTDLLRGHTAGSYYRNECLTINDPGTYSGCAQLDQLIGNSLGLVSAELRFPLLNAQLGFVPIGFPPIEGAFFWDAGVTWNPNEVVTMSRDPGQDILRFRKPMQTIGFSIRGNLLGFLVLRGDYSIPQKRNGIGGYWTLSIGPTW